MADSISTATAADLITGELEKLRPRIEQAIEEYCEERDWQKLRPYEMAGIATSECAVSMTNLVLGIRKSLEEVVRTSR